jgi:choline dehydrogenase-like flavoprotein
MTGARKLERADVLVVGSGAGGALVSLVLAEAGLKVVCLEQGPWVQPQEHPHYSPDWQWQRLTRWNTEVNVRSDPADYPIDTQSEHTLMWAGVGGATIHYTAIWPRLRPSDFRKGTEHGLAPDWPITYEDLEPFFETSDRLAGVSGWPGDPAIPPRGPFPTGPLPLGRLGKIAARGFERLNWHWWPIPTAIISADYDGRLACNHCGNCQSGCPRGSMYDLSLTIWPRAVAAGADLRSNARVERIELGADGRAAGAVYIDRLTKVRYFQSADIVIVACNGIGTPRLLLLSECNRFPRGLANSSDQVGRNLMHHTLAATEIWVNEPLDSHMGVSGALISEEFAETDPQRGFVNGFNINILRPNAAAEQALGSFSGHIAPWGAEHHRWFREHFSHNFGAFAIGDDLPHPDNRVTLSETMRDSDGLPAAKIAYEPHENDWRMMRYATERLKELASAVDAFDFKIEDYRVPERGYQPPAWHLLGTCRMGADPATSVTNKWHQCWDVPNLYIVDGSSFPTGGPVNPTSTICALALRAGSHIRDNFQTVRKATKER